VSGASARGKLDPLAGEAPVAWLLVLLGPGIARRRGTARATKLSYLKSEGRGYEVTQSVKQVAYLQE